MSDRKVGGYTGPVPPDPEKETTKADADKFKKIMKVEGGSEAEKKEKRALKKQPQEEEEGDNVEEGAAPPTGDFSKFMDEGKGDSHMDAGAGKRVGGGFKAGTPPPETGAPGGDLEMSHDEHELLGGPEIDRGPAEPPPPSYQGRESEYSFVPEEPKESSPQHVKAHDTKRAKPDEKKKKEQDTSLLAGKTKRGALKTKKALPEKEVKEAKELPEEDEAPITTKPAAQKEAPPLLEGEKIEEKPTTTPEDVSETLPVKPIKEASEKEEGKIGEKTVEPSVTSGPSPVAPHIEAPPPLPETAPTAYTKLHPQLSPLFDRMVGVMTIEQHTGVSTTTVTLNMPNSVFNGAEVVLNHYSSAPGAFNVELQGTPEAVDLFSANLDDLAAAFSEKNLGYQVNLQRPVIQARYRVTGKGGKDSGDKKK